MTSIEISDIILNDLSDRHFPVFLRNYEGAGMHEADVLGINTGGYIYEFEIKRSRSDFFADFKNKIYKHQLLIKRDSISIYDEWHRGKKTGQKYEVINIPNRFYYVCEVGLIQKDEIPEYAGLIYIMPDKSIKEEKLAKLLHKNKANQRIFARVATILSQRVVFGCSSFTHKRNEYLKQYEPRNETNV
jgi:hypothetical protein